MSRQSLSGAKALGTVFLVGLAVWVLAQIWVYLLIGGGLVLLGWLGVTLAKTMQAPKSPPQLVSTDAPSFAPWPEQQYRSLLPIDPKVFDDPVQTEAAATRVFAAWTRPLPMAPDSPVGLIRSLQLRTRRIGRLVSDVVERQAAWREAPYSGPSPAGSSNWTLEDAEAKQTAVDLVRSDSRHVAACARCNGKGTCVCATCGGTKLGVCSECNGAGKAYGIAKNGSRRLMNCKTCRGGKDQIPCSNCTDGFSPCANCSGSGRIERWIEVQEKLRFDIQVEPDGEVTRAFRWGKDGVPATRAEVDEDAKIVAEAIAERALTHDDLARSVTSDWLAAHWQAIQPKLKEKEMVRRQTFWLLEVPSVELSYGLAGNVPTVISLEGRRLLAPPSSLDRQFGPRAERIRLLRYIGFGLLVAVPLGYLIRGLYYWNGWLGLLLLCLAGLGVAIDGFVRDATLGNPRARKWAGALALTTILVCGVAFAVEPSARSVKRNISLGRLSPAEHELTALDPRQDGEHRVLWDELRLAQLLQLRDVATVARDIDRISAESPQRTAAYRHLIDVTSRKVQAELAAKDVASIETTLTQATRALPSGAAGSTYQGQLGELRSLAAQAQLADCRTDVCRMRHAQAVVRAASNEARQQQFDKIRTEVLESLAFQERSDETPLDRLRRQRQLLNRASVLAKDAGDDAVVKKAQQTAAWARAERGKIALLGANREMAAELLGVAPSSSGSAPMNRISHVAAYASMRGDRCTGLYLVGDEKDARALNDASHARTTSALLSQAFGHPVVLPDPPTADTGRASRVTKKMEGGIPIVARWTRGAELIELRIGDANP